MSEILSGMVEDTRRRIGEAFKELRRAGYVCRSAFMCCGTCAGYAIAQTPKYKKNGKAVYYHRQDDADFQKTNFVYLGWEGDGREIVAALERAGLRDPRPLREDRAEGREAGRVGRSVYDRGEERRLRPPAPNRVPVFRGIVK